MFSIVSRLIRNLRQSTQKPLTLTPAAAASPRRQVRPAAAAARVRRRQRGVFLLDAMIALTVSTTLVLYGFSLIMSTASASDAGKQTTIAYNAARQAVENVRMFRGAVLKNGTYDAASLGSMPQLALLNQGAGKIILQDFRGPVKKMTVVISWKTGGNPSSRSISIVSLISPGGVTP